MKLRTFLMVAAVCATSAHAQHATKMSTGEARQAAVLYGDNGSRISMWIWTDKYVYQPGEKVTLRMTLKTNDDVYPYTVVAYRQNNQNGRKFYFPAATEEATDIYGNGPDGFQAGGLTGMEKAVVAGEGGLFPAVTVPNEPGMHTIVVQARDYTGTRVIKAAYMKIGVVLKRETITGDVTSTRILTSDTAWDLSGIVFVKNNATLFIEPGTFIFGQPGSQPPSALIVTRNGKIVANGTRSRPIVMTSSRPFGERTRGDWGGLVMLGKAPINVGANAANNNPAGSFYIEGLAATEDGLYGGSDPDHDCGSLRYVRVEYAGSILSPNNELNSFTFGGCGRLTVADHLQAIYGLDDSFEWFGGTMDAKYLVGGLGADDYVDYQLGYTGRIQYGLFYQSADSRGNRGIEGDNSEYNQAAEPYSNPTMYNLTFIGSGQPGFDEANSPGIFLRRGSRGSFNNMVVSNFYSGAVDLNDANTQAQADAGNVKMNGIVMWKNNIGASGADTLAGQVPQAYTQSYARGEKGNGAGKNFLVTDPKLNRPFQYSDPDFSGMFGTPLFHAGFVAPPDDGFFDQSANFAGGIGDDNWTEEWTSFLQDTDIAK